MDCAQLANDTAIAFQQVFDMGGWYAVMWVFVGFIAGGGFSRVLDWLANRKEQ